MIDHDHRSDGPSGDEEARRPFLITPAGFALCVFLAIGAVFLWLEHRAHVLGALPLILPLAICIGMHFFMHRGHGNDGGHHGR
jgi:heme/copper-type cytochrome/quinol oxidase subunit 4